MKNNELTAAVKALMVPGLLVGTGLILTVNPDSATRLLGLVMGWALIAVGAYCAWLSYRDAFGRMRRVLAMAVCWAIGLRMLSHPLAVAEGLGRLAGAVLLLKGLNDVTNAFTQKRKNQGIGEMIAGGLLFLVPMFASRMVMSVIGMVMLVLGAVMGIEKLRDHRRLNTWEDSEYASVDDDYDKNYRK